MRISKLDGLRGLFSIMVVLFHYPEEYMPKSMHAFFLIRESYTFVDFFFVLSGFVIAYNYNSLSNFSEFNTYLNKRFIRLYPLLFYTVLVVFTFEIISNNFLSKFINNPESNFSLLGGLADSLLLTNSTPILGNTPGINHPSWSISSEIISYIVFGLVSILFRKRIKNIVLMAIIITSCAILFQSESFFSTGSYGFLRGLVSFSLGYFVYELNKLKFKLNNVLEYLIPIVLVLVFYKLNDLKKESIDGGLIFGMITIPLFFSLSILTLLKTNGFISKLLDVRPFQFLGKISYSVYLNHAIIVVIIPRAIFKILNFKVTVINEILVLIGCLGLLIFYSFITYKYIELGCSKNLRDYLKNKKQKTC